MNNSNNRADEIMAAASGLMDLAIKIRELADEADGDASDDGGVELHCKSVDLYESARHLSNGAPDPECDECGEIIPSDNDFQYPDECPHCGNESNPYCWAYTLDDVAGYQVPTLLDDYPEFVEQLTPIVEGVKQRLVIIGDVVEAIRIVRQAAN